jgi:hypothetical protein
MHAEKSEGPHSTCKRPELMCPDERSLAARIDRVAGVFFERSFGTKQNRRKTLRKLMAVIGGESLAYGLEIHLRGNSKVLGRIAILFFDKGGVLQRRRETPACGRRPDSFRRDKRAKRLGTFRGRRGEEGMNAETPRRRENQILATEKYILLRVAARQNENSFESGGHGVPFKLKARLRRRALYKMARGLFQWAIA